MMKNLEQEEVALTFTEGDSFLLQPLETFGIKQEPRKSGMTPSQRIRARQLAHVLYDKITQIMNTGELSEDILNKQVLITTVCN